MTRCKTVQWHPKPTGGSVALGSDVHSTFVCTSAIYGAVQLVSEVSKLFSQF